MHLIVPYAAPLSDAGQQALQTLKLPRLDALLARLAPGPRDEGDATSLSPPHERALARALGFAGADGELPWGAWLAAQDGIDTADLAWGLLTPAHWEVGHNDIRLVDPAALALDEPTSRALFEAVHPLFENDGYVLVWGAPDRWYLAHESLAGLATASLDRAIGRHVDDWLPTGPAARSLRRLQNEVQMLLHGHPLNAEREHDGALPVNSFWLSGCGVRQHVRTLAPPTVDDRLRAPALAEDWAAWADAWHALDAELAARKLADVDTLTLVLCGERAGVQYATSAQSWWRRLQGTLRGASATAILSTL